MSRKKDWGEYAEGTVRHDKDKEKRKKYIIQMIMSKGNEKGYDEFTIQSIIDFVILVVEESKTYDKKEISKIINKVINNLKNSILIKERDMPALAAYIDGEIIAYKETRKIAKKIFNFFRRKGKEEQVSTQEIKKSTIIHEMYHAYNNNLWDLPYKFIKAIKEGEATYYEYRYCQRTGEEFIISSKYKVWFNMVRQFVQIIGKEKYFNLVNVHGLKRRAKAIKENTNFNFDISEFIDLVLRMSSIHIGDEYAYIEQQNGGFKAVREYIKDIQLRRMLQNRLTQIFIGKRCKELGIRYDKSYYQNLTQEQLEQELKIWQEYSELFIDRNDEKTETRGCEYSLRAQECEKELRIDEEIAKFIRSKRPILPLSQLKDGKVEQPMPEVPDRVTIDDILYARRSLIEMSENKLMEK